jgi:predicted DNA-binding protein
MATRKRLPIYPEKISIVNITTEMRQRLNAVLDAGLSPSEAEFVRQAMEEHLKKLERKAKQSSKPDL